MQIPKEYLEERNYEGSRLIYIDNEDAIALKNEMNRLQVEEMNPILDSLTEQFSRMDAAQLVVNEKVKEIQGIMEESIPSRKKLEELSHELKEDDEIPPEVDTAAADVKVFIDRIRAVEDEISEIKESVKEDKDIYESKKPLMDAIDERAVLLKTKLQNIVEEEVKDQLGEFEKALHVSLVDGRLQVEVIDQLEEKIKQIRASK